MKAEARVCISLIAPAATHVLHALLKVGLVPLEKGIKNRAQLDSTCNITIGMQHADGGVAMHQLVMHAACMVMLLPAA